MLNDYYQLFNFDIVSLEDTTILDKHFHYYILLGTLLIKGSFADFSALCS